MVWNVFVFILSTLVSQIKNPFNCAYCWQVWWLETTLNQIKGQKKPLKKTTVKLSCSYSTNSEYVYCYGYRQFLENCCSIYHAKVHDHIVLNTPLIIVSVDYITHIHWTHYYWCNSVRFSSLLLCSKSSSPVIRNMRQLVTKIKLFSLRIYLLKTTIKTTIYPALNVIKYVVTLVWGWSMSWFYWVKCVPRST